MADSKRIAPKSDPDELGDLADPWDAWLNGDIAMEDLPEDLREAALAFAEQ
jgi:hypothetical protein